MNDTVENKEWVVATMSRSDSNACQILHVDGVDSFLEKENPILNPDGTEWGSWEIMSIPMSLKEANEFCQRWMMPEEFVVDKFNNLI